MNNAQFLFYIKLDNIVTDKDGTKVILRFETARQTDEERIVTRQSQVSLEINDVVCVKIE